MANRSLTDFRPLSKQDQAYVSGLAVTARKNFDAVMLNQKGLALELMRSQRQEG